MSEPPTPSQRRDRTGDLRFTEADKAILNRITTGDLADELAAAFAADLIADPLLGGPGLIP